MPGEIWAFHLHKVRMRTKLAALLTLAVVLLAGCTTRSISDSGYRGDGGDRGNGGGQANRAFGYRGELSEFDVLGLERGTDATDAQIASTLDNAKAVRLRKGANVLLIQSGAYMPDDPMRAELSRYFNVVPFSGRPTGSGGSSYSRSLRLAAAKAGCETVVCYWGTLESGHESYGTKIVSWVPVVGGAFPDEKQHMRIRLKVALVDVRSGGWTLFSPEPHLDESISARYSRETADQRQVEKLKQLAYVGAASDLVKTYAN